MLSSLSVELVSEVEKASSTDWPGGQEGGTDRPLRRVQKDCPPGDQVEAGMKGQWASLD